MKTASCPDRDRLQRLVEGSLPTAERADLDRHLEGCAACRDTVELLSGVTRAWVPDVSAESESTTAVLTAPAAEGRPTLGIYQIIEPLDGAGGRLLKAFDPRLQRFVTIRLLDPERAGDPAARRHFVQAARAAASVDHENVVTVHAVDEAASPPFVVVEFIDGTSLSDRLAWPDRPELKEIVQVGQQVAAGLAAVHARGLVHGNVCPAALLLEHSTGKVKLTEIGLDASSGPNVSDPGGATVTLTPDARVGPSASHHGDLVGLGGVLFALCTGREPTGPAEDRRALARMPGWLSERISALLGLDAAGPTPTAAETADLLRRQLIELQPRPKQLGRVVTPAMRRRRRRLALLALLLLAVAGFAFSEATGRTRVLASAGPLLSGGAILVVELEDPEAQVTLAGFDGDLTEPGTREFRLRPGDYLLRIQREGKPEVEETISLGWAGRREVTVRAEPVQLRERPFVVRSPRGFPDLEFATLADAIRKARRGDAIEVHSNGPFTIPPQSLGTKALTIRAAHGFRPIIEFEHQNGAGSFVYLRSSAALVLEGLDLRIQGIPKYEPGTTHYVVQVVGAPLSLTHCRLLIKGDGSCVSFGDGEAVRIRNCELLRNYNSAHSTLGVSGSLPNACRQVEVSNSVLTGGHWGIIIYRKVPQDGEVSVRFDRNTILARVPILFSLPERELPAEAAGKAPPFALEASSNVVVSTEDFFRFNLQAYKADETALPVAQVEANLPRLVRWQMRDNLLPEGVGLLTFVQAMHSKLPGSRERRALAEWDEYWKLPANHSLQGRPIFAGGDLIERLTKAPADVTPADFRLTPESPGSRSAAGQRDLGAEVSTVGPGSPYDRWKKTPEYRDWLKETGQVP